MYTCAHTHKSAHTWNALIIESVWINIQYQNQTSSEPEQITKLNNTCVAEVKTKSSKPNALLR